MEYIDIGRFCEYKKVSNMVNIIKWFLILKALFLLIVWRTRESVLTNQCLYKLLTHSVSFSDMGIPRVAAVSTCPTFRWPKSTQPFFKSAINSVNSYLSSTLAPAASSFCLISSASFLFSFDSWNFCCLSFFFLSAASFLNFFCFSRRGRALIFSFSL